MQLFYPRNDQATRSHFSLIQEEQIASIGASVAVAEVVAKAAIEAAQAIQKASKQAFDLLDCSSQPIFDQSGFARSNGKLVHCQDISKLKSGQHV